MEEYHDQEKRAGRFGIVIPSSVHRRNVLLEVEGGEERIRAGKPRIVGIVDRPLGIGTWEHRLYMRQIRRGKVRRVEVSPGKDETVYNHGREQVDFFKNIDRVQILMMGEGTSQRAEESARLSQLRMGTERI